MHKVVIGLGAFLLAVVLIVPVAPSAVSTTFVPLVLRPATPTATFAPTPTATPTRATPYDLRITYLQYSGRDEYVQISNFEPSAVVMTGWAIEDLKGDYRYEFPYAFALQPGAYVRVHSGWDAFENRPTDLLWARSFKWVDEGGAALLFDPQGRQVDVWGY